MDFYRRNLPHWQPKGAEFFITFRLYGSLPKETIDQLKQKSIEFRKKCRNNDLSAVERNQFEAKLFRIYDHLLDNPSSGPVWLSSENVAQIVADTLNFYDRRRYDLYAFSIMSNHVHLVVKHLENAYDVELPVTGFMKSIKSFTGKECNKLLKRDGKFWQAESFDRLIRDDEELENVILYTINNPVKANLVPQWKDWPFTYLKPEFAEST